MKLPPEEEIRETAIKIVQDILDTCGAISSGKLPRFTKDYEAKWKDPNNRTLVIDEFAHDTVSTGLKVAFGDKIVIYGEEEQSKPRSIGKANKIVAFVDAIDGTDLLVRDFENWCCAMVFVCPKAQQILCAVIGHSSGDIYYANDSGAYIRPRDAKGKKHRDKILRRDVNQKVELCHASLCFYGQKPKQLLAVGTHDSFIRAMNELKLRMSDKKADSGRIEQKGEKLGVRLYNFGGNPMMVKIPSRAVDAVFSLSGVEVHDVVPGAYIAVQSGAAFTNLQGIPINPATCLLNPQERVSYILSGSKHLTTELVALLGGMDKKLEVTDKKNTANPQADVAVSNAV